MIDISTKNNLALLIREEVFCIFNNQLIKEIQYSIYETNVPVISVSVISFMHITRTHTHTHTPHTLKFDGMIHANENYFIYKRYQ